MVKLVASRWGTFPASEVALLELGRALHIARKKLAADPDAGEVVEGAAKLEDTITGALARMGARRGA